MSRPETRKKKRDGKSVRCAVRLKGGGGETDTKEREGKEKVTLSMIRLCEGEKEGNMALSYCLGGRIHLGGKWGRVLRPFLAARGGEKKRSRISFHSIRKERGQSGGERGESQVVGVYFILGGRKGRVRPILT